MMVERGSSPMELFQEGEAELLSRSAAYLAAEKLQRSAETRLRNAKRKADDARNANNDHGIALLGQIHDAVTEQTDPGEYLQAVLNTYHSGQRVGDEVIARLAPMREQIRQAGVPVGVVGSTLNQVSLGLSAGDIKVRRRHEHETGFDVRSGVRLEVPMLRMNGFNPAFGLFSEPVWEYRGGQPEPYDVGVVQRLSNLRLASTEAEVQELNETPHAPNRDHDTVRHHEQDIKYSTGFVPFIAYGETAVGGLLAALYEGRDVASHCKQPRKDDVIAAAVTLGIPPETVTEDDIENAKIRLHAQFVEEVTSGVWSAIHSQAQRRKFPNSAVYAVKWPIVASPQVMEYLGLEQDEIADAARNGIERSIDNLRLDDADDVPSWFAKTEEYRLLEDEAREQAVGLVAVRYNVIIEPSELQSETLKLKLAKRLELKREEKERHEELMGKVSSASGTGKTA